MLMLVGQSLVAVHDPRWTKATRDNCPTGFASGVVFHSELSRAGSEPVGLDHGMPKI
jgi:hypothetical protein